MTIEQLLQGLTEILEILNDLLPRILHGLEELIVHVVLFVIFCAGLWTVVKTLLRPWR